MRRGEVWWADLGEPRGSEPGFRRPVVIVSEDRFNASSLRTVIVVALTSNLRLAALPGNVTIPKQGTGLSTASVANVTQVATVDKELLDSRVGRVSGPLMSAIDDGLRLVLSL